MNMRPVAAVGSFPYPHRTVDQVPPPAREDLGMSFLAPRGAPPVLQNLSLSQLEIDQTYQRTVDSAGDRLIREIARAWDWSLCQPLVVARRPDARLFVIDGQHRLAGARMRGDIPWLPCVVVDHATPAGEAAAFVALNARRRPLTPLALFRADLASGNPAAIAVEQLIEGAGLRLTGNNNRETWKPGQINNIVDISKVYRKYGDRIARIALDALAKGFDGEILRSCGLLFVGIVTVAVEGGSAFNSWLFLQVLRGADQAQWMKDIGNRAAEDGISTRSAAGQVMLGAYREAEAED